MFDASISRRFERSARASPCTPKYLSSTSISVGPATPHRRDSGNRGSANAVPVWIKAWICAGFGARCRLSGAAPSVNGRGDMKDYRRYLRLSLSVTEQFCPEKPRADTRCKHTRRDMLDRQLQQEP